MSANLVSMLIGIIIILLSLFNSNVSAIREEDLITNLPNVTFRYSSKQYAGYLNANAAGTWRLFYWLTESMNDPVNDPLIVWFNGGPGCSSLSGLLAEYGPFFVNRYGTSLFENVYTWNKAANMLFLESPVGTGFSYNVENPTDYTVGDDETAEQNFHALAHFFTSVQPKYRERKWIIAGESYAGIFIPTLTSLILKAIQLGEFPNNNFQGFTIGNGFLNVRNLTNSLLHWHYYHGSIGLRDWKKITNSCCENVKPVEECDFSAHIKENLTDTWPLDDCGRLFVDSLSMPDNQNAYNYYLDCYAPDQGVEKRALPNSKLKKVLQTANLFNYDFTDNQLGFNCWNEEAMKTYLNRKDVQQALHIADDWIQHKDTSWEVCNDELNEDYQPTYTDTFDLFSDIIKRAHKLKHTLPNNFRMLIFNGDVDTVCNFIGDAWHMDNVANKNGMKAENRTAWKFRNQVAGYGQRYSRKISEESTLSIDVLTVKGAGHFVSDRPGPALQMIVNFLRGSSNYSNSDNIDTMPLTNDLLIEEEVEVLVNSINSRQLSYCLFFLTSILLFVRF